MSFTTALFWFFILIGVVIYYVLPSKVRWMWLLVLSYLYYFSFNVKNSLFMVAVITCYISRGVSNGIHTG